MKIDQLKSLKPNKYNSPRNLDATNPQMDELGQEKETDSKQVQDSFQMDEGSWIPMIAKKDYKKVVYSKINRKIK